MSDAPTQRFSGKVQPTVAEQPPPGGAGLAIRILLPSDLSQVQQLLEAAPGAANWPEATIRTSINSSQTLAFAAEEEGTIAGFIFGTDVALEAEILNLAVRPQSRRRGIATALVYHLLRHWQLRHVQGIFLEARESNLAAINFYERLGFRQIGRRKKYYSEPEEDALVLERGTSNPQFGTR